MTDTLDPPHSHEGPHDAASRAPGAGRRTSGVAVRRRAASAASSSTATCSSCWSSARSPPATPGRSSGMLWSYINPLTQFLMYMFIFALLMGRGDEHRELRHPRVRGADGGLAVHRDGRGRHPLARAQRLAAAEERDAPRDVPRRLVAGLDLPPVAGVRDPRRRLVLHGLVARPDRHRGGRARLRRDHRLRAGAGARAQRQPGLPARHRADRGRGQQLHPLRRADDVPLQPGGRALPRAHRSLPRQPDRRRGAPGAAVLLGADDQRRRRRPSPTTCPTTCSPAGFIALAVGIVMLLVAQRIFTHFENKIPERL